MKFTKAAKRALARKHRVKLTLVAGGASAAVTLKSRGQRRRASAAAKWPVNGPRRAAGRAPRTAASCGRGARRRPGRAGRAARRPPPRRRAGSAGCSRLASTAKPAPSSSVAQAPGPGGGALRVRREPGGRGAVPRAAARGDGGVERVVERDDERRRRAAARAAARPRPPPPPASPAGGRASSSRRSRRTSRPSNGSARTSASSASRLRMTRARGRQHPGRDVDARHATPARAASAGSRPSVSASSNRSVFRTLSGRAAASARAGAALTRSL